MSRAARGLRRGFSLLEVIISSTLLVVGIAAVVVGANIAISLQEHQRRLGHALVVAERRMESLLLLMPGVPELTDGRHPAVGTEGFSEDGRPGGSAFRVSYFVTPLIDGTGAVGQRVVVTVEWDERVGRREISLTTARNK